MRDRSGPSLPSSVYSLIWSRTPRLQAIVVALGLMLPPLAVIPLEAQKRIVDDALPAGDMGLLMLLAGVYMAAAAVAAAIKFAVYYARGLIEAKVTRHLRRLAIEAQRRRGPAEAAEALGPATSVVTEEAYPLGGFAAEAINTPLIEGGALAGVFGFMLATEPALAAIGVGSLAAQGVVTPLVQVRINRMSARRVAAMRRASARLIEASERRGARFRHALAEVRLDYRLRLRMNVLKAALKAFLKLTDNLATVLVLVAGGAMAMAGETTLGVIVAFLAGMNRVREPWDALIAFYREFADAQIKYALVRDSLGPRAPTPPDRDPGPLVAMTLP